MKNIKNVSIKKNNERAITLIALVFTVIILIILASVLINITIGGDGIIDKSIEGKTQFLKKQYYEEINIEILTEQMERSISTKTEKFITSIEHRLGGTPEGQEDNGKVYTKKTWIDKVTNSLDILLIIDTVDGYEIYIDFDNENNTATIRENSFKKADKQEYTITYDANSGEGTTESQTIRQGLSIKLKENSFSKTNYKFTGWYKNPECTGDKYKPGEVYQVTKDETLYAKWDWNAITITYNADGGEGEMPDTTIVLGGKDTLLQNVFTKRGYRFTGWNDQYGQLYTDEQEITAEKDLTLTAKWEIVTYTIQYDLAGGTLATENPATYTVETDTFTLNNPTKSNLAFGGWTGSNGTTPQKTITITKGTIGNLTYTANWKQKIIDLFNNGVTGYITGFSRVGGENNGNYTLGSTLYLHTWGKVGVYNSINVRSNSFRLPEGYRKVYVIYDLSVKTSGTDARFNIYYVGSNTGTTWYDGWSQQGTQTTNNASRSFTVTDTEPCTIEFQTRCGGRSSDYSNATIKRIYCEYVN